MRVETRHAIVILASLLLLTGQLGCASGPRVLPPPPSAQVRATLGTIGVVSVRLGPEATVESPTSGKGSGAAKGAAAGFFHTAVGLGELWGFAIFPPAALVLGGVVLTGGVVGGVYGAVAAEDAAKVQEAETALMSVLAAEKVQEAMRERVFQIARDQTRYRFVVLEGHSPTSLDEGASYRSLASEGIDTILEISVPFVGLGGESGINPPLAVVMTVRTRLVRVRDVAPTMKRLSDTRRARANSPSGLSTTPSPSVTDWTTPTRASPRRSWRRCFCCICPWERSQKRAKSPSRPVSGPPILIPAKENSVLFKLGRELIPMTDAERAIEWPSSQRAGERTRRTSAQWPALVWIAGLALVGGCSVAVSGLRPEYPVVRNIIAFVEVDSLQPTLRWEAYPRPRDRGQDKEGVLARIRNVTYDVKIWRAENATPGEVVYTRQALPEPWHRLERPLEPSTKYFWTVRARFELDGDPRVIEWGAIGDPTAPAASPLRRSPLVPNPAHYRFKTP